MHQSDLITFELERAAHERQGSNLGSVHNVPGKQSASQTSFKVREINNYAIFIVDDKPEG